MTRDHGTITIIHTSFVAVEGLTALFAELAPGVELRHIVDDSLLDEVLRSGGVTSGVKKRLAAYADAAVEMGSDVIFSQCSSVGEAIEEVSATLSVPIVRIDSEMARIACKTGPRIGVVATLETTLSPTSALIERTARSLACPVALSPVLVEGAFADLRSGDLAEHNRKVVEAVRELATRVDVVVCAQGSMAAIEPLLGETPAPVLTSPRLGVQNAIEVLDDRLAARSTAASIAPSIALTKRET